METVKKTFWKFSNKHDEFYRLLENKDEELKLYVFRVYLRGKLLTGIIEGNSVKHVASLVTGQMAWSLKDILY